MPTSVGPNTYGEENLVFGYDLGDSINSYKGEPAYNRHDYDKSVMSQTGFNNWSCYDGNYTASYHTWDIAQSKTLVNIPGPDGKYTNAMLYHNFDGGFYGPTDWGGVPAAICTAGNKITLQAWVKAADASSVGKTVTPYMYFSLNAGGAEATATNYTLTADWQLISHTHTMSANATNNNNILYFFTQNSGAVKMYLTKTAVLSGIDHAVQWLPGGQTRSATQGLIDLTGNSTIDLTNVSFDSNAQMTFDGTNDKAVVANFPHIWDGSVTMEAVVAWNDDSRSIIFGNYNVGANDINFEKLTGRTLRFYWNRGERDVITASNVVTTTGNPHHVVMVRDKGANLFKFYVDGVEIATSSNVGTDVSSTGSTFRIGGDTRDGTTIHNGDIPMLKLYNRALTASEVASNFKAIKGRFNI